MPNDSLSRWGQAARVGHGMVFPEPGPALGEMDPGQVWPGYHSGQAGPKQVVLVGCRPGPTCLTPLGPGPRGSRAQAQAQSVIRLAQKASLFLNWIGLIECLMWATKLSQQIRSVEILGYSYKN